MRQQTTNQLRAMLNAYQLEAPRAVLYTRPSQAKLAALRLPEAELQAAFDALRAVLERVQGEIQSLTRRIASLPRREPELASLMARLPHLGAQSGATLRAELGDPRRFKNARAVAAYAGLVPSVAQSADTAHHGPITKQGNRELRWILSPRSNGGGRRAADRGLRALGPESPPPPPQRAAAAAPCARRGRFLTVESRHRDSPDRARARSASQR
jgi:transposase